MSSIKILIVEDELLIAKNLAGKLKKLEYTIVDIVSSGEAALQSVSSCQPDLILMDIAIKGSIDGIETAAQIKTISDVPIIYLTAYADDRTLERAASTSCYGYILKPFRVRELHATIKMALNKHQEQVLVKQSLLETGSQYSSDNDSIYRDPLTNLPNQLLLRDLFDHLLSSDSGQSSVELQGESTVLPAREPSSRAQRTQSLLDSANREEQPTNPQKFLAVLHLNLDRFQRIYDTLGNSSGDLLIQETVERLTSCIGNGGTVIRLHNDAFVILQAAVKDRQTTANFARIILERLRQPFILIEREIFLTASIGISLYPSDDTELDKLLQQANMAMRYAQEQGGNQYKFYTTTFRLVSSNDLCLETDLHYALERKELEIHYQPKVNCHSGQIVGAEALLRWAHPERGLIAPDRFITLAEESGLIETIGEWVLKHACQQAKVWHKAGLESFTIAVNISGRQFKQLDLFHKIAQILSNTNLDPNFLILELTEKILVEDVNKNIQRLNFIKKLGVQIALDDFGTGYSSLSYLQQFPFDMLKIDRCFVRNVDKNRKSAAIIQNIIQMAHDLDLKVTAEGIERQAELDCLRQYNCDELQGYLFSYPLSAQDFEALVLRSQRLPISL
ncbi:EAL domain-containing protein [Pleurocapsales cyanobacterium LEGE 06147]|nr:EAL domain-containing protein [Pleurocapsales cyanobacterium LEGE 06147]